MNQRPRPRQRPRHRRRLRLLGAVAAVGIGATALSACDTDELKPSKSYEDEATVKQKITAVRVDGENVSVALHGKKDVGEITLRREAHYKGDHKPEKPTHRVENGVLILNDCGDHCSVDYRADIPEGIPVSGRTTNGDVDLSGLGAVHVTDTNGDFGLRGMRGAIDVTTTNGSVDVVASRPQSLKAKSTNGDVTVTVPDAEYRVEARTTNGDKNIGVRTSPSAAHRLDLETTNGDVTVKGG